jgi:hypothetical protein
VACRAVARAPGGPPSPLQSVFAFASLKLRRTPRFVLQAPCGCATRSPKGEAWWARQRPYKAAFPEGFRGLIERLNRRVPTKIPTKLPRGRRSVCRPYVQSSAALRSNYQGSLMAISRKNILEVDPGTRRPMADGAVNQLITRRGLDRDRIRLSRRRRSRSQSGWNTSSRAWKINLAPGEACDRPGSHPFRSAGGAVSETRQGRQRKTTSSCRT